MVFFKGLTPGKVAVLQGMGPERRDGLHGLFLKNLKKEEAGKGVGKGSGSGGNYRVNVAKIYCVHV